MIGIGRLSSSNENDLKNARDGHAAAIITQCVKNRSQTDCPVVALSTTNCKAKHEKQPTWQNNKRLKFHRSQGPQQEQLQVMNSMNHQSCQSNSNRLALGKPPPTAPQNGRLKEARSPLAQAAGSSVARAWEFSWLYKMTMGRHCLPLGSSKVRLPSHERTVSEPASESSSTVA